MSILDCNDPADQEEAHQLAYTARMAKRPPCGRCGRRIWTDTYLDIGGNQYCQTCADYCTRDTAEDFDFNF